MQWLLLWPSTGSRMQGFSSCSSWVLEHRLSSLVLQLSDHPACGFYFLPWKADSLPLDQQGSPRDTILFLIFFFKVKLFSRVQLFATPWTIAYQAPPPIGFSRQGYWSGLPLPSPGDLPDPGIEPRSSVLQADALPSEPPGKPIYFTLSKL